MRGVKSNTYSSDLGLALLQRRCIFGVPLTQEDIAAWMGITRQRVDQIERKTIRKMRIRLQKNAEVWAALKDYENLS